MLHINETMEYRTMNETAEGNYQDAILNACRKAFDNSLWNNVNRQFSADLIANTSKENCMYTELQKELDHCSEYAISVAFVTTSGWTPMSPAFEKADKAKKKGRLLTTDYLYFTDPKALRHLSQLENLDIRLFRTEGKTGFHTKGYLFRQDDLCRIIVGSSNLTQTAIMESHEWNARLVSKETGEFAQSVLREFDALWESENAKPLEDVIDEYEKEYRSRKAERDAVRLAATPELPVSLGRIEPNLMQRAFVEKVMRFYREGKKRALLISATGTGKTFAAAFAAREMAPKKTLFLVHREQIARQAMKSFLCVLAPGTRAALYTGSVKDERALEADIVFATMQTLSREEHARQFSEAHFDLIIIDEVHRAGAPSYGKIMAYFKPRFWLGMTASPDRPDGFDIYALFDHNIAGDIRLKTALEEDLLCPFHYFGVADVTLTTGEQLENVEDVRHIPVPQRVNYILERANFFGYSGDRVKGLVFCSTNEDARALSDEFNRRGYSTLALSGSDNQDKREEAIARLVQDEKRGALDYIFSVDIFNEGVDIKEVNQVIFQRPTESAIIFVQQLGRGLRKAPGKDFVVVIDFIGNYRDNFLIPIALSGDNSYNKDRIRRFLHTEKNYLHGVSTIHFDPIAEKTIYRLIDSARTNDMKLFRASYDILKRKLGRVPTLSDFDDYDEIDPCKFFDRKELRSYYAFLKKADPTYTVTLTARAAGMIAFFSTTFGHAKRPSEALLLEEILAGRTENLASRLRTRLRDELGFSASEAHLANVMAVLAGEFMKTTKEKTEAAAWAALKQKDGSYYVNEDFLDELGDADFRSQLEELIAFVKNRYRRVYSRRYKDTMLVLNESYTYEDVCRLLDWTRNLSAQNIGGYFYDKESKTLPVFINYEKADDAIRYEDRFVSRTRLIALSKTKRRVDSVDATHIYKREEADRENRIYLFVRRNKDDKEAKSFYFLGEMQADPKDGPKPVKLPAAEPDAKPVEAFEIHYRLETPVSEHLYHYITEGSV